jgi:ElaB/YqjD/DUF883 family membrane-anchored ribosome-binding protein
MSSNFDPRNSGIGDKVEAVREEVADRAREASAAISDAARRAGQTIDESRSAWADTLDSTASTIRDGADDLSGGSRARDFARGTANRLSGVADYVRSHDTSRIVGDVERVVKNNPGPALVVAAAFGFLLGRALRRG